jgi:signal transduction histidine kinase
VVDDVEGAAQGREIMLHYQIQGEPQIMLGDENRLYHMALNLLDNAVKYSPDAANVYVTLAYGHEQVTLEVADEGQGISDEDLAHIFEKYFRGSNIESSQFGVGLGLSVVQTTAVLHGGQVTVSNRPRGGARFVVELPLKIATVD